MTLKAEILTVLKVADAPLTALEVLFQLGDAVTAPQVATALWGIGKEGLAEEAAPREQAEGRALKTWRITEAGRAVLSGEPQAGRAQRGGVSRGRKVGGRRRKAEGQRRKAGKRTRRVRKVQRRRAVSRAGSVAARRAWKTRRAKAAVPQPALTGGTPRWALASDGAFLLLGTATEIPRPAARALVEFVRVLDEGEA
ncbi:MAG: hypothetical protein IT529_06295 [Burkholderiales bacterium]|nr:hypothetical protein [Burkholderiales bacterium]